MSGSNTLPLSVLFAIKKNLQGYGNSGRPNGDRGVNMADYEAARRPFV